jgi:quercetin dioxygenase-like cupin family protein
MSTKVVRKNEAEPKVTEWGSLQWLVSRVNGASEHMTLGRVTFKPGKSNPVHQHPNCEEILFVISGQLEHTLPEGGTVRLQAGDCIVLPPGGKHQAKNIGSEEAVVLVAFNSADRRTVEEV